MINVLSLLAFLLPAVLSGSPQPGFEIDRIGVRPDVVYGHKFGLALTLDVYQPPRAGGGAVIFVNSGGYESGQLRQWESRGDKAVFIPPDRLRIKGSPEPIPLLEQFSFIEMLAAGLTVFDLHHGSSPKFTLDEIAADVRLGVTYIKTHAREFGVDADRLALFGASSGGHLAVYQAVTGEEGDPSSTNPSAKAGTRVRAVGAYYPAGFDFSGTLERYPFLRDALPAVRVDKAILDAFSIRGHVSADDPPLFIIYGEEDFPFIIETCNALKAAYEAAHLEIKVVVIPGTGHEFRGADGYHSVNGLRARKEMAAWLSERLK
jgi:dienelactone hydrolase